jgi:integrase
MQKKMVKVTRHGNRKFFVMYYDDEETGKRVSRSTEQTTKEAAKVVADRWEKELLDGSYRPKSKMTWDTLVERFGKEKMPHLKPKTRAAIDAATDHFTTLVGKNGTLRLAQINEQTISRFQTALRELKNKHEQPLLRETSIACHLRHVKWVLSWAKDQKLIREVPTFEMPNIPKGSLMRGAAISESQFHDLLAAVPLVRQDVDRWQHLLRGLWLSGLRLGEALAVSWDPFESLCIDLSGKRPRLRILGEAQKSGKDELLPLTPDFCEWLLQTPEEHRVGPLFTLLTGGEPMNISSVGKIISAIGEKAKIIVKKEKGRKTKYVSAHDLRRSFGKRWAMRVPSVLLQKLMRHSSLETTLKYYVDLQADEIAEQLFTTYTVGSSVGTPEQPSTPATQNS